MLPTESWRRNFNERYPIYQQIVYSFCRSLVKGELNPGDRIPSIRELAIDLKVNTNTIQRAYQEMERNEMIFSQRGTGYFVMKDAQLVDKIKDDLVQQSTSIFLNEMRALGFDNHQIVDELNRQIKKEAMHNASTDN